MTFGRQPSYEEQEKAKQEIVAAVLKVACPYCKAAPGERCVQVGGKLAGRKLKAENYHTNRAFASFKEPTP